MEGLVGHPLAPAVHGAAAAAAWLRGDLARARRIAERGTGLGEGHDDPARAFAFEARGDVASFQGRLDDAATAFREEVRLARLGEDPETEAMGRASLALVLAYGGRTDRGVEEADAAARVATRAGPATRALARYTQGECRAHADPGRAAALLDDAVRLARDCGAWFVEGIARLTATSLAARGGEPRRALPGFRELVRHWRRTGSWTQQWTTLRNLTELLVRLQVDEPAVAILAAAEVGDTGGRSFGAEAERLEAALATARGRLGEAAFEAARTRGHAMSDTEVVELALSTLDGLLDG